MQMKKDIVPVSAMIITFPKYAISFGYVQFEPNQVLVMLSRSHTESFSPLDVAICTNNVRKQNRFDMFWKYHIAQII